MNLKVLREEREKKFICEVLPGVLRGSVVVLNSRNEIRTRGLWEKRWGEPINPHRLPWRRFSIVSLDASLSFSATIPVVVKRKNSSLAITRRELEDEIVRILEKNVPKLRRDAMAYLGVGDLDVVLIDARTSHFTIDGKEKTLSPVGANGSIVYGLLHVIFSTREAFHAISSFIHEAGVFITEEGASIAALLAKLFPRGATLIYLKKEKPALYALRGDVATYAYFKKAPFGWDVSSGAKMAETEFGVSRGAAEDIVRKFSAAECSVEATRYLRRLFGEVQSSFSREVKQKEISGEVFLSTIAPLPLDLGDLSSKRVHFKLLSEEELPRMLGFRVLEEAKGRTGSLSMVAPFLECYYYEGDPLMHRFLQRRIHWIAT
ncbi:MAG: hypothetical protein AAB495_01705 [Patescibacteria group bacterium]